MSHAVPPVLVGRTDFSLHPSAPSFFCLSLPEPTTTQTFELLDGPPYANGPIHLGHAYNKHLKDLLARARAAQGARVSWRPGWDCHGLPVELCVEREGGNRHEPLAFVPQARAYAARQVALQKTAFQALGVCADWAHPYLTMDPAHQAGTLRVFAELLERGRVDVRHRPVPWCAACRSTLAAAEQEEKSTMLDAALAPFVLDEGDVLVAWTTTPWTLPYHAGLAVHPKARYRRWVADGRPGLWAADEASARVKTWWPDATPTDTVVDGTQLSGKPYTGPCGVRGSVVADARVAPGGGTGVLHAVPAFSVEDAALGRTHGWDTVDVLAPDGRLTGPAWAGHHGLKAGAEASAPVLEALTGAPWFRALRETHTVAACWRHKAPLLTRPSRQVYLALDAVREHALRSLDAVAFEPASARGRLRHAVETRPDWCLSRQRLWGVPMALYLDRTTGQPCPNAAKVARRVADAVEREGVEAWWREPDARWLDGLAVEEEVERVDDVLDVWFDSGAVAAVFNTVPDAVVEGHDQVRGWFQSALWVAAALERPAPFRQVVVHGFVVGPDGRKLSKSDGGDRVMAGLPAWTTLQGDVVRVWAAQGETGQDRPWSKQALTQAEGALARWRGCVRFALANVPSEDWGRPVRPERWPELDRQDWRTLRQATDDAVDAAASGLFHRAATRLRDAAEKTLSQGLFMRLKDRLYCAGVATPERQAAVEALRMAVGELVRGLRVLTPQLVAEAEAHCGTPLATGPVNGSDETDEGACAQAHAWAAALQAGWEPQAQVSRGGLARGAATHVRAERPSGWSEEDWLDALGLGEFVEHPGEGGAWMDGPEGVRFWLGPSPHPTCTRCRRPAADLVGVPEGGCCARCHRRTMAVTGGDLS